MSGNSRKVVATTFVLGLFAGSLGGAATSYFVSTGQQVSPAETEQLVTATVYEEESQLIDAIAEAKPAVVSVIATKDLQFVRQQPFMFSPFGFNDPFGFSDPFGQRFEQSEPEIESRREQVSSGTGFIVSSSGMVITNKHVVEDDEADYTVVFTDGTEYPAGVIDRDPANDLAVLQIFTDEEQTTKAENLPFLELGDSNELAVGQRVIAIGNALGEFENTVTTGIISAESRQIEASNSRGGNRDVLSNLLQTDAAINQGNSGGPLINLAGQVVGVNTAIASNANGIGFAIPAEDVAPILASVERTGRIVRPQLGVRYRLLSEAVAQELELPISEGALLVGDEAAGLFAVIPDSPASRAGLQIKDVILEINGTRITTEFGLRDAIRNLQPGDTVEMLVWREGEEITLSTVLEEFGE